MESQLVRVLDLFAKQWVSVMAWGSSPRLSAKQNGLWCNGSTTDSDSVSRGSNPCRPAKHNGHEAEWLGNALIRRVTLVQFQPCLPNIALIVLMVSTRSWYD